MNFIKENVFLVGVVGVVLVGAIATVALKAMADKTTERNLAVRTDMVDQKMNVLVRGQKVNKAVVQHAEQRVNEMKDQFLRVTQQEIARNGANYEVLTFELDSPIRPELGKKIPAFPVEDELYRQLSLALRFQPRYQEEVKKLLQSMQPTQAPTKEEIESLIKRLTALEEDREPLPKIKVTPGVLAALGLPALPPSAPAVAPAVGTGTVEDQVLSRDQIALAMALGDSATRGWIYADEQVMFDALPSSTTHYQYDDLWWAQVALWVQRDIVAAINLTNETAQKAYGAGQAKGVPSSAVKRLVEIDFRGFVINPSMTTGARAATNVPANLTYLAPAGATAAGGTRAAPRLTGRACNPLYDVVHYEFAVVVRTRDLLALYDNLMAQNYHTILEARIEPLGQQARVAAAGGPAKPGTQGENYYYGTVGLVQVRVTGELLLLTARFRGAYELSPETRAITWTRKPLMPPSFLALIQQRDAGALREGDKTLAGAAAPGMGAPGGRR